jgi:predicted  nucleic acid-binding Zn-ribbon protein
MDITENVIDNLEQENAKLKTEREEYQMASLATMQDFADLLGVEPHHCTSWGDLYNRVSKLKAELAEVKQREVKLREALVHISEYWNGQDSYNAMIDACERMTTVAKKALR